MLYCCAKTPSCPSQAFPSTPACFLIEQTTPSQNTQLGDSRISLGERSGLELPRSPACCRAAPSGRPRLPHLLGAAERTCVSAAEHTERTQPEQHLREGPSWLSVLEEPGGAREDWSTRPSFLLPSPTTSSLTYSASLCRAPEPKQLVHSPGRQRLAPCPLQHGITETGGLLDGCGNVFQRGFTSPLPLANRQPIVLQCRAVPLRSPHKEDSRSKEHTALLLLKHLLSCQSW